MVLIELMRNIDIPFYGGRAAVPPPPEAMPQTWRGTYHGDRDYMTALRCTDPAEQEDHV